jgi:hypothetical protein
MSALKYLKLYHTTVGFICYWLWHTYNTVVWQAKQLVKDAVKILTPSLYVNLSFSSFLAEWKWCQCCHPTLHLLCSIWAGWALKLPPSLCVPFQLNLYDLFWALLCNLQAESHYIYLCTDLNIHCLNAILDTSLLAWINDIVWDVFPSVRVSKPQCNN